MRPANARGIGRSKQERRQVDELILARKRADPWLYVPSTSGLQAMASLLGRRLDAGKATVVTTNATSEQVREGLGSHLADRLLASHVVACRSRQSMRAKGAA